MKNWKAPVAAILATAMALLASPSSAADNDTTTATLEAPNPTVAAERPAISITATRTATDSDVGIQTTITCTARAHNPHKSSHYPGTINGVASITCTSPVMQMNIGVRLSVYGYPISTGSNTITWWDYLQANAHAGCATAVWQTSADVWILFPPGFTPTTQVGTAISIPVYIEC